ncbi:hypothetical protein LQF12_02160 [Ruania suaedae]|uniref:hypothetical protein n=1 Tax=Ruania suaedae TaxID=2897774 RepID=UPI001E4D00CE|nr:hypothetical protein [Ruania suaedae]UFU03436.1 hypothetical protein LQF12_02160 [Ruania suaedae]
MSKSTTDRYREAGMPTPKGEAPAPDARHLLRRARSRAAVAQESPLVERVHDPAADGPVLPEIDPATYGPDSVPLPDANQTEEIS